MFFYASKIFWLIAQPSSSLLLLTVLGLALLGTRWARAGKRLAWAGVIALLVLGFSPLGNLLILPLEARIERADLSKGPPLKGIIVLGGAIDTIVSTTHASVATNEAGERMTEAVRLARLWPNAKILFSGGSGNLIYKETTEAVLARKMLGALGIAESRVILESTSRNTYENAVHTLKRANPRPGERWLLITSAYHMPRALGCFRKAGFPIEPWPVDCRTRGVVDKYRFFTKPSEGLRRADLVTREWLGLIAYRLTGRVRTIFPAP